MSFFCLATLGQEKNERLISLEFNFSCSEAVVDISYKLCHIETTKTFTSFLQLTILDICVTVLYV